MVVGPVVEEIQLYICNECADMIYNSIYNNDSDVVEVDDCEINDDADDNRDSVDNFVLYTPSQINEHLDKYIIGQHDAKMSISVAIYNHYKRIMDKDNDDVTLEKSNLLMIGPSGSGKTLIVKTIAKLFDLPYVIADATTLTEAGYIGEDALNILGLLLHKADHDVDKAQKGIVFIDEIDKLGRKSESSVVGRDVSGEGVQQALLKMVEGTVVQLYKNGHDGDMFQPIDFDTSNILFISSGAFVDLPKLLKETRKSSSSIGFGADVDKINKTNTSLGIVESNDLIKYGIIPEFVGRFPIIVTLHELTEDMLISIMTEPKNSILSQYKKLFKKDNVELSFDKKYLTKVAQESIKQKVGARGLRSIIERHLLKIQYELPDLVKQGLSSVVVGKDGDIEQHYKQKTIKKKAKNEAKKK